MPFLLSSLCEAVKNDTRTKLLYLKSNGTRNEKVVFISIKHVVLKEKIRVHAQVSS